MANSIVNSIQQTNEVIYCCISLDIDKYTDEIIDEEDEDETEKDDYSGLYSISSFYDFLDIQQQSTVEERKKQMNVKMKWMRCVSVEAV